MVVVGQGFENWLSWNCKEKSGVALAFIHIWSVGFSVGLTVTSIGRGFMTVVGIFTAL